MRRNAISRCAIGIASAPNLTGPLFIEENVITDGRPGHYGNVQCFKVGHGGQGVAYYTANRRLLPGTTGG